MRSSELGVARGSETSGWSLCAGTSAPTGIVSGEAARAYLDVDLFAREGIEVEWQNLVHPVYPQLHGEFVSHLSALDLILNCGEESAAVLAAAGGVARMKRILVTGGAGFIGSNFVHHLYERYPDYHFKVVDA